MQNSEAVLIGSARELGLLIQLMSRLGLEPRTRSETSKRWIHAETGCCVYPFFINSQGREMISGIYWNLESTHFADSWHNFSVLVGMVLALVIC
jgi:hypothetical protein